MLDLRAMRVHDDSTAPTKAAALGARADAPRRCGAWTMLAEIAAGGFGHVFEAEHSATGRKAAVKILRRELSADSEAVARFEREAALLDGLALAGFVELYERGRLADGRPFMAMELLSGHDLKWWIQAQGRLSVEDTLAVLGPLCRELGAAHARGIVHRDVKASNVFLTGSPRCPERVTLLDFGLAKLLDSAASPLTASRQILGTPASMAPEQIVPGKVDERTDIYALGALTFHLLAAELPFKDASIHVVCQMHLHARVPSVSSRAPVSPELDLVIARAMGKRPEDRYRSCAEFYDALSSASRGSRVSAAPREVSVVMLSVAVNPDGGGAETVQSVEPRVRELFESVIPLARTELERLGMTIALRAGDLLLAYWELVADETRARQQRQDAIDAALDLNQRLARHLRGSGLSAMVTVASGNTKSGASGLLIGSELTFAVPPSAASGGEVLTTEATLAGLELRVLPCGPGSNLLRVPRYPRS